MNCTRSSISGLAPSKTHSVATYKWRASVFFSACQSQGHGCLIHSKFAANNCCLLCFNVVGGDCLGTSWTSFLVLQMSLLVGGWPRHQHGTAIWHTGLFLPLLSLHFLLHFLWSDATAFVSASVPVCSCFYQLCLSCFLLGFPTRLVLWKVGYPSCWIMVSLLSVASLFFGCR